MAEGGRLSSLATVDSLDWVKFVCSHPVRHGKIMYDGKSEVSRLFFVPLD